MHNFDLFHSSSSSLLLVPTPLLVPIIFFLYNRVSCLLLKRNLWLCSMDTHSPYRKLFETSPSPDTMWSWGQQSGRGKVNPSNPLILSFSTHCMPNLCWTLKVKWGTIPVFTLLESQQNKTHFALESTLCPAFCSFLSVSGEAGSYDDKKSVFGQ